MNDFSSKIKVISFWLSVLIVYYHSQFYDVNAQSIVYHFFKYGVEVLHNIGDVCVPFFFIISGYLFFRTFSMAEYLRKLTTREKSLFVPYLIWNGITVFFLFIADKIGVSKTGMSSESFFNLIFGTINARYSVLWYVKYLMYFALLSPILYFFIKTKKKALLFVLIVICVNAYNTYTGVLISPLCVWENSFSHLLYYGLYFSIGVVMVLYFRKEVEHSNKQKAVVGMLIYIVCIAINIYYSSFDLFTHQLFNIVSSFSLWFAIDLLKLKTYKFYDYSFFIYCSHWIILLCIQNGIKVYIPSSGFSSVINFYISPLIVVGICLYVVKLLKSTQNLFFILTGGRG